MVVVEHDPSLSPADVAWANRLAERIAPPELRGAAAYLHDPLGWMAEFVRWPFGSGLTDYQEDIVAHVVVDKRVSARGPHGLGKTALAALLVCWFAATREAAGIDWKVITTASAWRQLEKYLWPEIRKWVRVLDFERMGIRGWRTGVELLQMELKLKLKFGSASAVATDDPALIEGAHADHLLYIFDEAKAIPIGVWDAAEGAFAGGGAAEHIEAYAVAISTPGEAIGRFWQVQTRKPGTEDWWVRRVTLEEAIAAGRISKDWAAQRKLQWGESSPVYQNRVLGEFSTANIDGIIPLSWVEAANNRWSDLNELSKHEHHPEDIWGPLTHVGGDIASTGSDFSIVAKRHKDFISELLVSPYKDTMQTTGLIASVMRDGVIAAIDVIGVGTGVVDRLREQDFEVDAFNGASEPFTRDRTEELEYLNRRAEAWWGMREKLDPTFESAVALPPDDELIGDLCAPKWSMTSSGKVKVERKDEVKQRLGRSPDRGDAVVMAYAARGWELGDWAPVSDTAPSQWRPPR